MLYISLDASTCPEKKGEFNYLEQVKMSHSNFHKDLNKEAILGEYLDMVYPNIFRTSGYAVKRVTDLSLQYQGVDLLLFNKNKTFYVDEKAQLDYLNTALPTFAFELSYLKNNQYHKGWLFDSSKITNIYFLITCIHTNTGKCLSGGVKNVKITAIYRDRLIESLAELGLTEQRLLKLDKSIRASNKHGKHIITELHPKYQGALYYSMTNKAEKPINLVLKLSFLSKLNTGSILLNS
ncbi:conserved hypothetical protein [Formosa agariphila KMM 3901]|uniref:Uncharacterized protein n=1 Tax=Formosa agariphila (strain DSM 15362 / KCTC 12365 / LMG 23005 / KMM 3901 / M-2Alg 35-1) TaxID=1347342 RepID=T2KNY4_FORAG|nr:hypothetical protein [Formosa agariphila]CDF80450.1 conserved hypothetical protein [Formosa agariphila KMM 3901]